MRPACRGRSFGTQNLEKRLAADANTPGSLAYLQHRIDAAQAAHDTQLVTTLTNRMTYRKQLASVPPAAADAAANGAAHRVRAVHGSPTTS